MRPINTAFLKLNSAVILLIWQHKEHECATESVIKPDNTSRDRQEVAFICAQHGAKTLFYCFGCFLLTPDIEAQLLSDLYMWSS